MRAEPRRPRTLALGRPSALFYRSIRSAMFAFGDVAYCSERRFPAAIGLGAYLRRHRIDQVLMPNPYGNPWRLACYRWLRAEGVPTIACDRGALPQSWFFDEGFLFDSGAYRRERWDRALDDAARERVRTYVGHLRSSSDALEQQGRRGDIATLRRALGVSDRRVLLVPLQRPRDTAVRYFAGPLGGHAGFEALVTATAAELRAASEPWTVVVKQHPLEDGVPHVEGPNVRLAPPDAHVHDLIELADACLVLTSGVGLLSLAFGTPTLHAGLPFYGQPGLSRYVTGARDAAAQTIAAEPVDRERVERFLHHLLTEVYSFGASTTRLTRDARGARFRATDRIDFRELRVLGREHRLARARVLMLSPVLPWPVERGSQARIDAMTRALIDGGALVSLLAMSGDPRLDVASAKRALRARYPEAHRIELVRHPGPGVARVGHEVRRALDLVSGGVHEIANLETCPPRFRRRAAELCARIDPTHMIVSYAKLTPALPEGFDGVTIVDTHDCQSRLVEESQRHAGTRRLVSVPRHERSERAALGRYDRVVAINPDEARCFAEWAPHAEVSFIPHFSPAAPLPSISEQDAAFDAFFVGSASSFNVLALRWLLEEILPRVREAAPKFRLAAVGAMTADARIPQALRSRATLLGRVNDIERIYRTSRIVIAPIRAGAGMKTKIVEALAFRRPVVCTSVAAEGIALVHRESAWIADDAMGLADGLLALHRDQALWEHLAAGGLALHARDHSPGAVAPAIEALLTPASGGKTRPR